MEKGKILLSGNKALPLKNAASFDVGVTRPIGICPGDKILIRANQRSLGLINGQVLTVGKIEVDGSLHMREDVIVPAAFRQWTHGYVVTSHKAQGRTCERVVVAAARLDAKAAYVACSRGRESCSVHTPDKAALISHLPAGNRRAVLDILKANPSANLSISQRLPAYRAIMAKIKQTRAVVARLTEQARQIVMRQNVERQRIESTRRATVSQQVLERNPINFVPVQSQKMRVRL